MSSRRTLKLALFSLVGFTVVCMAVVEFVLGDRHPSVSRMLPVLLGGGPLVSHNSSSLTSWESSGIGMNSSGASQRPYTRAAARPSLSGIVDHCEGARQATRASSPLNLKAQTAENGTRPVSCRGCFHTDFPPLLENCGVCNTGAGGRSDRVDVLLAVLTTHKAVDRRQAIRDTWASVTRHNTAHVRHVFLLGRVQVSNQVGQTERQVG